MVRTFVLPLSRISFFLKLFFKVQFFCLRLQMFNANPTKIRELREVPGSNLRRTANKWLSALVVIFKGLKNRLSNNGSTPSKRRCYIFSTVIIKHELIPKIPNEKTRPKSKEIRIYQGVEMWRSHSLSSTYLLSTTKLY
jgi:hypothetical protein